MLTGGNYYGLQLTNQGPATTTAYYYVTLLSSGSFAGAALTIYPTAAQATYFSCQEGAVQFQAPAAARLSGGITVVTTDTHVAGNLGVSPAINSDVVLTIYGAGKALGSVTLPAGQTSVPFDFKVESTHPLASDDAGAFLAEHAPPPAQA